MSQTSNNFSKWLSHWRDDLLRGSAKDPLVHLDLESNKVLPIDWEFEQEFRIPFDNKIKAIVKEQREFARNNGVNVLCLVREFLFWREGDKSYQTPIFLSECNFLHDKILQEISINVSDEVFLNPYLVKTFQQKFDRDLSEWLESDELPHNWERKPWIVLGNFHYHRFTLLKDYDFLDNESQFNESLLRIFLEHQTQSDIVKNTFSSHYIFPLDADQQAVFDGINNGENLVVEGPPGSGKSQVLTNVLFHAARVGKHVLLCSEKKTALDVVASKLRTKGISEFCFVLGSDVDSKSDFIRSLQNTWQQLEIRAAQESKRNAQEAFLIHKKEALQLKMLRLSRFPMLPENFQKPAHELSFYPVWEDYKMHRESLFRLVESYQLLFGKSLNSSCFICLKPLVFKDAQTTKQLLQQVRHYRTVLSELTKELSGFTQLNTSSGLDEVHRVLIHAQILTQELFQKNADLFNEQSRKFKKLHRDYERYLVLKETLDLHDKKEGFKWKNPWSSNELEAAKQSFSSDKIWQSNFRKWKRKFIASYQPAVFSRELAIAAIDSCLGVHDVMEEQQKLLEAFTKLGIHHPEVDFPLIFHWQRKAQQHAAGLAQTKIKYSSDELSKLLDYERSFRDLHHFVQHYFMVQDDLSLDVLFDQLLLEESFLIGQHEALHDLLNSALHLPKILREIVDFQYLDDVMLWGAVKQFEAQNPQLFHYKATDLSRDLDALIEAENLHFAQEIQGFWEEKTAKFIDYHQLITAPIQSLNQEEKLLRKTLKSGRAQLIREFNKTRQHTSISTLLAGDAAVWIQLLKPIMIMSPIMLSKSFPMAPCILDLILFDEASQMPFSHSIPAIFRAKQFAVFGDSQQLSPSSFFVRGGSQRSDLLTESRHFLPIHYLSHHYRSKHPSLIAFSNRYFYSGRLQILPACQNHMTDGVFCHYIAAGVYEKGRNTTEAKRIITFLKEEISRIPKNESVGIVAFSERQLAELEHELTHIEHEELRCALEDERITLSSLEKVQGDEFDVLLISMAYGRDANGDFALRMGPLNQEGGERRLNVLFSRAKRALHFFHSVQASDFGYSDNLGVQLLKNFLLMHSPSKHLALMPQETVSNQDSKLSLEIVDPFYRKDAVTYLMILKRHTSGSGLDLHLKFRKDEIGLL